MVFLWQRMLCFGVGFKTLREASTPREASEGSKVTIPSLGSAESTRWSTHRRSEDETKESNAILERNDTYMIPIWLRPLLNTNYSVPFKTHGAQETNYYTSAHFFCLDCMEDEALCTTVFLITKIITNFREKIVYLNARPQSLRGKGVHNCEICYWCLPEAFRFCSFRCKHNGMELDPNLSFVLRSKHNGSSDTEVNTNLRKNKKISSSLGSAMDVKVAMLDGFSGDNEGSHFSNGISPVSHWISRRKGIPREHHSEKV